MQPPASMPTEEAAPVDAPILDAEKPGSFRLLVALDNDPVARAVARVAAALAQDCGAIPSVLQVIEVNTYCEPSSSSEMAGTTWLTVVVDTHPVYRNELLARVSSLVGRQVDWKVNLDVGIDVQHIVRRAQDMNANLIIMGREHHGAVWRARVGDTVRQVVASEVAPVLAVVRTLHSLPCHAVVGIDFSASSIHAARWARRLLHPNGVLELVYVAPGGESAIKSDQNPPRPVRDDMEQLIASLGLSPGMRLVAVQRSGSPAEQLRWYAERVGADLIAVGHRKRKPFEPPGMGGVSVIILHDASCSVLIAPPEPA